MWAREEMPAGPLRAFRLVFAALWLVYDVIDVTTSGTAHLSEWLDSGAPRPLVQAQCGLIVCEVGLLLLGGTWVMPIALIAAACRLFEWDRYLRLNDFAYYVVTVAILANTRGPGLLRRDRAKIDDTHVARWPRDVLLWQAGWTYLATGMLKLSPAWLSGGHLWVRFGYLAALGWHYPGVVLRCTESLACDQALSVLGAMAELSLGALLLVRPRRRIVLPLALGIHIFGALMTNVWFFGPSLIAQIAFLTAPRASARAPRVPS